MVGARLKRDFVLLWLNRCNSLSLSLRVDSRNPSPTPAPTQPILPVSFLPFTIRKSCLKTMIRPYATSKHSRNLTSNLDRTLDTIAFFQLFLAKTVHKIFPESANFVLSFILYIFFNEGGLEGDVLYRLCVNE